MLAAVLTMFLVFSLSGVAVLNLSSFTAMENQDAVQSLKNQYAVESAVNVAMWKVNNISDSFGSYEDGYVSVSMDTTTDELVASIDRYGKTYEIAMDLSEDHHFNRGIAATDSIELNDNELTLDAEHRSRQFSFLPDADLDYFMDNATEVHSGHFKSWEDDTLNGIHVFTGSFLNLEDIVVNGTLVFTGRFIFMTGSMTITAPADTNYAYPAMVFTHENETVEVGSLGGYGTDTISGAIYAKGRVLLLENAELTGPVIGRVVSLSDDYDFLDSENNEYYKWTRGFGAYGDYSWPKHIGRWRVSSSEA